MSARDRRWNDRGEAIGHGVSWLARWSLRLALVAIGFVLLWTLIGKLWVVVMPVLLGLLITTVLWPPARWL
ncbi:AI-2E family transporter, partial [Actinosynnema sp. NPDC023658]